MGGARNWIAEIVLRSPTSLRSLRNAPVLGNVIHRLSYYLLSPDQKVWAQIEAGPARGIWLELNPRTGQDYLRGEVERAIQATLEQRLRSGDVLYDLGANIGLFYSAHSWWAMPEGFSASNQITKLPKGSSAISTRTGLTILRS